MMRPAGTLIGSLTAALLLAAAGAARAHGGDTGPHIDMLVASTAPDGGRLALVVDPPAVVRTSYSDSLGGLSLYTASAPGFAPLEEDAPGLVRYRLAPGTQVMVELVDTDGGRAALTVGGTALLEAGARAVLGTSTRASGPASPLHQHPEYILALDAPRGVYGAATLSVRLRPDSPRYRPSRVYRLTLSNGHLPRAQIETPADDPGRVACRRTVAQDGWAFLRDVWTTLAHDAGASVASAQVRAARDHTRAALLASCGPDAAGEHDAPQLAAFLGLTEAGAAAMTARAAKAPTAVCRDALRRHGLAYVTARARALRTCLLAPPSRRAAACGDKQPASGPTMVGRVLLARARAERAIGRRCPAGIGKRFLDRASCRADDLVSAAFPGAGSDLDQLKVLGSPRTHRVSAYFPCAAP